MKIQIDTIAKTLKVEEDVKLEELINALNELLPGKWKKFTLQTNVNWQWTQPIIINTPRYPFWQNPWYVSSKCSSPLLKEGIFNVEYQAQI